MKKYTDFRTSNNGSIRVAWLIIACDVISRVKRRQHATNTDNSRKTSGDYFNYNISITIIKLYNKPNTAVQFIVLGVNNYHHVRYNISFLLIILPTGEN
jgi:hypothetical protein